MGHKTNSAMINGKRVTPPKATTNITTEKNCL